MGRKRSAILEYVPDDLAEGVARICGPHSGHAKALEQCHARRAEGEDVHLWKSGNMILVGPEPSTAPALPRHPMNAEGE